VVVAFSGCPADDVELIGVEIPVSIGTTEDVVLIKVAEEFVVELAEMVAVTPRFPLAIAEATTEELTSEADATGQTV
jgi:hypothetical protein